MLSRPQGLSQCSFNSLGNSTIHTESDQKQHIENGHNWVRMSLLDTATHKTHTNTNKVIHKYNKILLTHCNTSTIAAILFT